MVASFFRATAFVLLFALLFFCIVGECEEAPQHYLFSVKPYNGCVMINGKGELLSPPVYRSALAFSEGLAAVKKNGKWGYVDRDGKVVIDYKFPAASKFSCGRAIVNVEKKPDEDEPDYPHFAVIDRTGNFVVPPGKYKVIDEYTCDRARVGFEDDCANGGYIDLDGNLVLDARGKYEELAQYSEGIAYVCKRNNHGCMIDLNGKELFKLTSDSGNYVRCVNGRIPAKIAFFGEYGYLDKEGRVAFALLKDVYGGNFSEGYATVVVEKEFEPKELRIYDVNGNVVFSRKGVRSCRSFSDGVARFKDQESGSTGYIGPKGVVIPPKWMLASNFHEGKAWVLSEQRKVKAIMKDGSFLPIQDIIEDDASWGMSIGYSIGDTSVGIFLPDFHEDRSFIPVRHMVISSEEPNKVRRYCKSKFGFHEGLTSGSMYGDQVFWDTEGNIVLSKKGHDSIPFRDGRAAIETDFGWKCIDRAGKEYGKGYCGVSSVFCEGRLVVYEYSNGMGVIDTEGNEVIPCNYIMAPRYVNGFVLAKEIEDSEYIIFNRSGKVATEEELKDYQAPKEVRGKYYQVGYFSEGLAKFQAEKDSTYGFLNREGKIVVEPQFDSVPDIYSQGVAGNFENGLCVVIKDGKCGVVDCKGSVVVPFEYEQIGLDYGKLLWKRTLFKGNYCAVKKDGKWGFVDRSGKEVIAPLYDEVVDYNDDIAIVGYRPEWSEDDSDLLYGVIHIKDKSELLPFRYSSIRWKSR